MNDNTNNNDDDDNNNMDDANDNFLESWNRNLILWSLTTKLTTIFVVIFVVNVCHLISAFFENNPIFAWQAH